MTRTLQNTIEPSATMDDIARQAGVSRATVSYVLNQRHEDRLNPETKQRVLKAAQQLGYRPNLAARGLKNRKTMLVGVLVQNNPQNPLTHPLTWHFVLGINDGLLQTGYSTVLVRLSDVQKDGGLEVPVFKGHMLDGMIVVNQIPPQVESRIGELVKRCVWLDANIWEDEYCIRRDEAHAAALSVQKLLEAGYRKLECVLLPPDETPHFSRMQRLRAIRQAAQSAGMELVERIFPRIHRWPAQEWDFIHQTIKSWTPEHGIIAESVYIAQEILENGGLLGKRAGHDFALVCCDDHQHAPGIPQLSRVTFERYDLGRQAAAMMIQSIEDKPCPSLLVKGEWINGDTFHPRNSNAENNFKEDQNASF